MAWIKFDKDLIDDPRILRAADALAEKYQVSIEYASGPDFTNGVDLTESEKQSILRNAVTGALLTLWVYADTHIRERDELGLTPSAVDRLVGIEGFCDLMGPEWIAKNEDGKGVRLPGYCAKNGLLSKDKRRTANAERQRRFREKRNDTVTKVVTPLRNALDQDLDQDLDHKKKKDSPPPSGAFLRFWTAWPSSSRKQSKGQCWERWLKLDLEQTSAEILAHVESLKVSTDWQKNGGEFIPAPLVYLNQRRWEGAEAPQPRADI